MDQYQTQLRRQNGDLPTLLEFKRIAYVRGLLSQKEVDDYLREEKGAAGEQRVYDFLSEEGASHWTNIRNLWLNNGSTFECDSVLFTSHKIHTFEIKHYTGRFTYKNGSCNIGNLKMDSDCIQQARKSFLRLNQLCQSQLPRPVVHGGLIFSSNKNKVVIDSPVEDIQFFEMPDLYEYIQRILQEERNNPHPPTDWQPLIHHLEQFEITSPFYPKAMTDKQMKGGRKGICCAMCKSFDVNISKHFVDCACGYHESREEAIVRSACEYGVLTYDRNFSTGDIMEFIDHQGSSVFVQKVLATHFKMVEKNKYTYYENLQSDYPNIFDQFKFKRSACYLSSGYPKHIQFIS